jgi:hypothetical protein
MPPRRGTTANPPTPIEEAEPTSQPVPEPDNPQAPQPEEDTRPDPLSGFRAIARQFASEARDEYPLSVHEAIAEVTRRVEHIAKDHRSESGERYAYRGIDDVLLALHPILGDVGLVILPGRMREHRRETRTTSKGSTLNVALVRVRYRLIGPDGTSTSGEAWGEAHDSGDKATQKALSQAYKSFTLQLFSIPTEGSAEDEPDRTNEPGRPFAAEEVERAQAAWRAASDTTTVEELAAVRRRALALLDVPLPMASGTVIPLGVLFDQQRAVLEGGVS